MKESYGKDPASHPDPESCVGGCEDAGEALDRETGSDTENEGIGCFKAIALPAKDQTRRLEPVQGTAGSFLERTTLKTVPGAFVRFITNPVDSVIAIINTASGVQDAISYDPFGNIVAQTHSAEADQFMFAGMEYGG
jgi:hypothetical protein